MPPTRSLRSHVVLRRHAPPSRRAPNSLYRLRDTPAPSCPASSAVSPLTRADSLRRDTPLRKPTTWLPLSHSARYRRPPTLAPTRRPSVSSLLVRCHRAHRRRYSHPRREYRWLVAARKASLAFFQDARERYGPTPLDLVLPYPLSGVVDSRGPSARSALRSSERFVQSTADDERPMSREDAHLTPCRRRDDAAALSVFRRHNLAERAQVMALFSSN
ncbi:hypothetical protein C8F04DRAFT_1250319 [Mycena alexandri]|uniref:Uncharacterized protein n=1 Tax=Mycena alexandri TaxID=1745969 RepID=A0AAD6TEV1_9AGAR|nr:hypothetical protein C8F04DRAFT_1250319 [Mycena alexandri]